MEVVELTKKLIAVPSFEGNNQALVDVLAICKKELADFTVEEFQRNGVKSILVYKGMKRPETFKVLLNGHVDIVPGKNENYLPSIDGDKLYGVGSLDMKASVACLINVFKTVAPQVDYPLGLQIVTDEEIGGFNGTKYQVEQGVRAEFVIAGEPTNFEIVHEAKGVVWLKITSSGKTAHGAYPWRGVNAIWRMHDFLSKLQQRFPIPPNESWKTTLNLSDVSSNNDAFNKIPDSCTIHLDIRVIKEDEEVLIKEITSMLPNDFSLQVITNEPAMSVSQENPYVQQLQKYTNEVMRSKTLLRGANGSSDARHFVSIGCPGIEFGPEGGNIGSDTEWVSIKGLNKYVQILTNFLTDYNTE